MGELTTVQYAALQGVSARTVRRHAAAGKLATRWDGRRYLIQTGDPLADLAPGGAAWLGLMSASKVAAVLGLSPYQSPYALWHEMKGLAPREPQTKVQARGHFLEAGVLAWWRAQHDVTPGELTQQVTMRLDDWGIATLDETVYLLEGEVGVEAKTSGSWDEWGEDGTDEVPAHYYAQCLWQLACAPHLARIYVPVLGPRLDFREYVVERDDALIADVVDRCRQFYDSLAQDVAPPLDDHVATLAVLKRMHPDIDEEVEAVVGLDLATRYLEADTAAKAAEAALVGAKSALLEAAGSAKYVKAAGVTVARRQPNRSGVSLVRVAETIPTPALEAVA